eukprot:GHVT01069795.1.p1 GENE.GHVT01069795.1~~GHVT01069795.1.p1  ORF type:complete len:327 (+),score=29.06 GHVT01069795.1:1498-2478(+)
MQGVGARGASRGMNLRSPASAQCLARIHREKREIQKTPSPYWCAYPLSEEEPFEWHFTIRGPRDSDFEGGIYHGRIVLPQNYPFAPPNVMLLTHNGRFEVGKKVCLSASSYHPELWQPAWGIRTILDALSAFFPTPAEGAIHGLDWPVEVRRKIARESVEWKCSVCQKTNVALVEEYCAQMTYEKPSLPEPLQEQAELYKRQRQAASSGAATRAETTSAIPPVQSSPATGSTPSVASSSTPSAIPTSAPSGPQDVASSSDSSSPQRPLDRRRPERASRSLLGQLLRVPQSPLDAILAAIDIGIVFVVGALFVLLLDLLLWPPKLWA